MPIRVTCTGCHTRFNVSEKFAGKEGPCPKCKAKIKIPAASEEVKIHEPDRGPTDSAGRPVLKPIARKETALTSIHITLIVAVVIAFFAAPVMMRFMIDDKSQVHPALLGLAALMLAFPVAYAAYTFLRDQELGSFQGQELWTRISVCSAIYAALWLAMPIGYIAFGDKYELGTWLCALGAMLGIGGAVGMLLLDFDYLFGLLHYGMYLGCCLIGRWIAGIGLLPGMIEPLPATPETTELSWQIWMLTWSAIF